jgi:NADPH2:quinone reductase
MPVRRAERPTDAGALSWVTEYVVAPVTAVLSFQNDQKVSWRTIGAIPEMLQTVSASFSCMFTKAYLIPQSYGILTVGGDAKPGQTLFIRGGTSSIGMMLALLGKDMGMKVISTTRSKAKEGAMKAAGVDEVVIDDGKIAEKVRALVPEGVDVAVELVSAIFRSSGRTRTESHGQVGANVIRDSIRTVKHHGTLVFAGMLSNDWTLKGALSFELGDSQQHVLTRLVIQRGGHLSHRTHPERRSPDGGE